MNGTQYICSTGFQTAKEPSIQLRSRKNPLTFGLGWENVVIKNNGLK